MRYRGLMKKSALARALVAGAIFVGATSTLSATFVCWVAGYHYQGVEREHCKGLFHSEDECEAFCRDKRGPSFGSCVCYPLETDEFPSFCNVKR